MKKFIPLFASAFVLAAATSGPAFTAQDNAVFANVPSNAAPISTY